MRKDCYIVYSVTRDKETNEMIDFDFLNVFETLEQAKASLKYEAEIENAEGNHDAAYLDDETLLIGANDPESRFVTAISIDNSVHFHDRMSPFICYNLDKEYETDVEKASQLLKEHYDGNITRISDTYGIGCSLMVNDANNRECMGLRVYCVNSTLESMSNSEVNSLRLKEHRDLSFNKDSIMYQAIMHLDYIEHEGIVTGEPGKTRITPQLKRDFKNNKFASLDEAAEFLFKHCKGVKEKERNLPSLDEQIKKAEDVLKNDDPNGHGGGLGGPGGGAPAQMARDPKKEAEI